LFVGNTVPGFQPIAVAKLPEPSHIKVGSADVVVVRFHCTVLVLGGFVTVHEDVQLVIDIKPVESKDVNATHELHAIEQSLAFFKPIVLKLINDVHLFHPEEQLITSAKPVV
jgi:hypothetical protein